MERAGKRKHPGDIEEKDKTNNDSGKDSAIISSFRIVLKK